MAELFHNVEKVILKLVKLQQADPPAILWEGVAKLMRFALLGLILLAACLLVQGVVYVCTRQWKRAVVLAVTCVLAFAVPVAALAVPIAVAPTGNVMSIAIQTPVPDEKGRLLYGNDVQLDTSATRQLAQMLETQACRRTLRQTLPPVQEDTYNLVVTLEGGKRYQLRLTPQAGWRYFTEGTDFLCSISEYDAFYAQIKSFVKGA